MRTTTALIKTITDRKFGFVRDMAGNEAFFHASVVRGGLDFDDLTEGQTVLCDINDDAPKGSRVMLMKPLPPEADGEV